MTLDPNHPGWTLPLPPDTAPPDARTQEIAERWAKTTPGPCASDHSGVWTTYEKSFGGPILNPTERGDPANGIGRVGDNYPRGDNRPTENMQAIAAAPDDIAWLLAEVSRLRAALSEAGTPTPERLTAADLAALFQATEHWKYHRSARHRSQWCRTCDSYLGDVLRALRAGAPPPQMLSKANPCPSCKGDMYHYAGCGIGEHGDRRAPQGEGKSNGV